MSRPPFPAPFRDAEGPERSAERVAMVREQIEARGIDDPRVLAALRRIPRHRFVPAGQRERAHEDNALPLGDGQTISQPYIVALMTAAAAIKPGDKVLEIGTGSGYQAALLAELGAHVFTIERLPTLASAAASLLHEVGYREIQTRIGDGTRGWPEEAPFDAILATAAPSEIPRALTEQLAEGGRLVIPVGQDPLPQNLVRVTRRGGHFEEEVLLPVRFVPLIAD